MPALMIRCYAVTALFQWLMSRCRAGTEEPRIPETAEKMPDDDGKQEQHISFSDVCVAFKTICWCFDYACIHILDIDVIGV